MYCTQMSSNPDIYEIAVPFANVSTSATNCYVVCDGGESLVIDVGAPTEKGLSVLKGCLADIGVDLEKTAFFLTHFHLDHAGLSDALIPAGAKLYVSEAEYRRTRPQNAHVRGQALKERFLAIGSSAEEADMVSLLQEEGYQYVSEDHDLRFVSQGDIIEVGSRRLQVIDTSGHTAGHLSLYETGSRMLFGGDHLLFVISPSIDYFGEGIDGLQIYLDNLKKLNDMRLEGVLCSHGEFREDHYDRIDWLISHHKRRLDEVCSVLEDGKELSGIELIRAISWNVPADSWEGVSLVQRAIIITQGLVILDHLVSSGRLARCEGGGAAIGYRQQR